MKGKTLDAACRKKQQTLVVFACFSVIAFSMVAKGGISIAAERQPGSVTVSVLPAFSPLTFNQF